tara:strand:+ start:73 stop:357 length:285 start_codon:yes stop_codon:yes gene_type:complete
MLNTEEIKALIVCRIYKAVESGSGSHSRAIEQQIKALITVLDDGVAYVSDHIPDILDHIGVPYQEYDDTLDIDPDWLAEHGIDDDGNCSKFKGF